LKLLLPLLLLLLLALLPLLHLVAAPFLPPTHAQPLLLCLHAPAQLT
jgi:hypothetical protein